MYFIALICTVRTLYSLSALLCLATTLRFNFRICETVSPLHTHIIYTHIKLANQGNSQVPDAKLRLGLPNSLCVTDLSVCWVSSVDTSFSHSSCTVLYLCGEITSLIYSLADPRLGVDSSPGVGKRWLRGRTWWEVEQVTLWLFNTPRFSFKRFCIQCDSLATLRPGQCVKID